LGRDLLIGEATFWTACVVIVSTIVYALLAIAVAARMFGAEGVLYGAQIGWSDLWIRPTRVRGVATLSESLMCLILAFSAYYYIFSYISAIRQLPLELRLTALSLATAAVFLVIPLFTAWWTRISISSGFSLHQPRLLSLLAALICGLSAWVWAHELVLWTIRAGIVSISAEQLERAERLPIELRTLSAWFVFFVLAIVPAVCEEAYFRGFLLRSLLARISPSRAILASSLLFGVFHVITPQGLLIERLLPSTVLGILLGFAVYRSGTVVTSIVLHALHNGLLIGMAYFQPYLESRGWAVEERSHLPGTWLIVGLAAFGSGFLLLWLSGLRNNIETQRELAVTHEAQQTA
jgi:ABC-2 type transport system permease protein/sodium transport system permease protein